MEIICLANSYKNHNRCIAGINLAEKRWIRPISIEDGSIPLGIAEPINILDVLEIPINDQTSGHEIENSHYDHSQPWRVVRKAEVTEVLRFRECALLHSNYQKSIPFQYLKRQAPVRTLQLIEVKQLECVANSYDPGKWRAIIHDSQFSLEECYLSITDPVALQKLNHGEAISHHCLIILSFSQPWRPDNHDEEKCYRLVAGIIESPPDLDLILIEMQRVGWSEKDGKKYLQDTFAKQSRYQLTSAECQRVIRYLQGL
ncbi:MAG: hypothetical protein VKJ27_08255 [Synechocystis sp.]|nr:hypothetical protein [Synechocystis sp.]